MSDTDILAGQSTFPHDQHGPAKFRRESARLGGSLHQLSSSTRFSLERWCSCQFIVSGSEKEQATADKAACGLT